MTKQAFVTVIYMMAQQKNITRFRQIDMYLCAAMTNGMRAVTGQ